MIYILQKLPKALEPTDINKAFNNFQLAPELSKRIQQINGLRDNFYKTVYDIEARPSNQLVTEIDWLPLFEYINSGPDLLEIGVKNANYPFNFRFSTVLSPSKEILINNGISTLTSDNEVAVTIEMLISRYSFSFTLLKTCSGHIHQLREAVKNHSKDQAGTLIKEIKERLKAAIIRIYKLWASEALILPGLKGRTGPPEFFPGFSIIIKR